MYIVRNALKNISRSKGRSILIGAIILVLVFTSSLGLSIRQAAETSKEEGLKDISITGQITIDMGDVMDGGNGEPPDREEMKENLANIETLSLDELQKYAEADSVNGFYYTLSESVNGSNLEAVTAGDMGSFGGFGANGRPGGMGMMGGSQETQGDFTLTGYSEDEAMTDFTSGSMEISDGEMFEEGTTEANCVISEELATLNELAVGDSITLVNPDDESKTVAMTITGTFTGGMNMSNQIMTSYQALEVMNEALGLEGSLSGVYQFDSVDEYEKFEVQAEALGLDEKYTVMSQDINQFENSLRPLENLSKFAMIFVAIILAIGMAVLVIMNMFSIRERKYEVGVLTAMGMKKKKVATQFIVETLAITLVAIIIGTSFAGIVAKPVTNSLLSSQLTSSMEQEQRGFGREMGPGGNPMQMPNNAEEETDSEVPEMPANQSVTEVESGMDLMVVVQVIIIGLLLSLASSGGAIYFITRYNPLEILTDRD